MELAVFIQDLVQQGKVTVAAQIVPFSEEDIQRSIACLQLLYNNNAKELTGAIPAFDAGSALWAATYLYRAVQLAMLRSAGDDTVNELLTPFTGPETPETIVSADLCLRYLPDLLSLAKGLAPGDILVQRLQETAAQWPFSSVGLSIPITKDITILLQHTCLRQAYIDRIIATRDAARSNHRQVNEYLTEALGNHSHTLWPGWQPLTKES